MRSIDILHREFVGHLHGFRNLAVKTFREVHQNGTPTERAGFALRCLASDAVKTVLWRYGMTELLLDILLEESTFRFILPPSAGNSDEYVDSSAIVSILPISKRPY